MIKYDDVKEGMLYSIYFEKLNSKGYTMRISGRKFLSISDAFAPNTLQVETVHLNKENWDKGSFLYNKQQPEKDFKILIDKLFTNKIIDMEKK